MKNILFAMPFVVLCAFPVRAADVYMVQGDARGPVVGPDLILWTTDGFFYNNTAADAHVLFLGVSNGPPKPEAPAELVIRPQHSASFSTARLNGAWRPLSDAQLWVIHLDVPDNVAVDSALFVGAKPADLLNPFVTPFKYGKIALPVFTSLVPAGQAQIHLATFLGDPTYIASHANVAIYNAGAITAMARVEVHQQCDEAIVDTRTVAVPANSIIQVTDLPAQSGQCSANSGAPPSSVYTTVTVDQPSFSFVSNVANGQIPLTSMSITAGSH